MAKLVIPDDLKKRYEHLSSYRPMEVAVTDIRVPEWILLIERIARAEAEVKELKSAQCPYEDDAQAILDGISPEYVVQGGSVMGTLAASVVKLEAQVKTLTAQLERYEKPVSEACKKAAVEICNTYDIETPRGKTYANRPPVTISIIIEQALLASRKAAKND